SFTIESPTLPGKPRTFARFSDFVVESANARVWAGFHWRNSTVVGAQLGSAVAQQVVTKYLLDIQPPPIVGVVPSVDLLWPPSGQLVPVSVQVVATDNCEPAPVCEIVDIASSEPVTSPGDSTSPDWEITGPLSVSLRAERLDTGPGRNYTITV